MTFVKDTEFTLTDSGIGYKLKYMTVEVLITVGSICITGESSQHAFCTYKGYGTYNIVLSQTVFHKYNLNLLMYDSDMMVGVSCAVRMVVTW
jgi:hypothetical protein